MAYPFANDVVVFKSVPLRALEIEVELPVTLEVSNKRKADEAYPLEKFALSIVNVVVSVSAICANPRTFVSAKDWPMFACALEEIITKRERTNLMTTKELILKSFR